MTCFVGGGAQRGRCTGTATSFTPQGSQHAVDRLEARLRSTMTLRSSCEVSAVQHRKVPRFPADGRNPARIKEA